MDNNQQSKKVTCPVCSAQCEALVQYCEQCGWHFELFLSQPDQEQQAAYQQRLERHRDFWNMANTQQKKTVRDVPSSLSNNRLNIESPNDDIDESPKSADTQSTESVTKTNPSKFSEQSGDEPRTYISIRAITLVTACLLCILAGSLVISFNSDKTEIKHSEDKLISNVPTANESKKNASKEGVKPTVNLPPKKLSKSQVQSTFRKFNDPIHTCFRNKNAGKLSGTLWVRVTIQPSGEISSAFVDSRSSQFKGTDVGQCVIGEVRNIRFPISQSKVNFAYPFVFKDSIEEKQNIVGKVNKPPNNQLTKFTSRGFRYKMLLLPTISVQNKVTSITPKNIDKLVRKRLKKEPIVTLLPSFTNIRKQLSSQISTSTADRLFATGIGLITAGENQKAMQKFQQAVIMMKKNIADLQNYQYLVLKDALLNLALAYFLVGYDLNAHKSIKEYAHLNQKATLDKEKFPTSLIKTYTSEIAKIAKFGPGKLVINSNIKGAKIYIDGVYKGIAPSTLTNIMSGYHYVVLRDTNGNAWSKRFFVRGKNKEQVINAQLIKKPNAVTIDRKKSSLPEYYNDLLKKLNSGTFNKTDIDDYLVELSKQTGAAGISWILVFKEGSEYVAVPFVYKVKTKKLIKLKQTKINLSSLNTNAKKITTAIANSVRTMP